VIKTLIADFKIIFERDPAARNWLEVLFCYPGLQALWCHRFAHWLFQIGLPFVPRFISHMARFITGVEIHPGATIGKGVFIDHGMGVVIGETAIVGDFALIYQGVTLGGTGKEGGKRHPTLGENVVIGTGAKVLGNIQLGNNVRVGAGSVVLRDVPSDCTVVGVPGRVVYRSGERVEPLEHGRLPDSEAQAIRALLDRIEGLESQLRTLQQSHAELASSHDNLSNQQGGALQAIEKCYAMASPTATPDCTVSADQAVSADQTVSADQKALGQRLGDQRHRPSQSCRLADRAISEFLDGSGI
jgi:serine O-acetyltransferase